MKQNWIALLLAIILMPGWASGEWVKDQKNSSRSLLGTGQSVRLVPDTETEALALVRSLMTEKLHLSLAEYHAGVKQQDAKTTLNSQLAETIANGDPAELAGPEFYFVLEVELKSEAGRTRISATAYPVYPGDNAEARQAQTGMEQNSIEIKVKPSQKQTIFMGPMVIVPRAGQPDDYNLKTLPHGAELAAKLVRTFMHRLDENLAARK